jgi:hypothetical protein
MGPQGVTGSFSGSVDGFTIKNISNKLIAQQIKTTEIEKNLDKNLPYRNGAKQEVKPNLSSPVNGGLHGFRYVEKYDTLYGSKRSTNAGDDIFWAWKNLNDLSTSIKAVATGAPANYRGCDQIVYSAYKDKLYGVLDDYNYNSTSTRIVISEIDPVTLVNSIVVNFDMTSTWWGAIGSPAATYGKYLYCAFTNKAYTSTRVTRVDLDDFTLTHLIFATPYSSAVPHAMAIDEGHLYMTTIWGTQNYISKISLSSFTVVSNTPVSPSGMTAFTALFSDDLLIKGEYIYAIEEGSYTNKNVVKISKTNPATQEKMTWLTRSDHNLYAINSHNDLKIGRAHV